MPADDLTAVAVHIDFDRLPIALVADVSARAVDGRERPVRGTFVGLPDRINAHDARAPGGPVTGPVEVLLRPRLDLDPDHYLNGPAWSELIVITGVPIR